MRSRRGSRFCDEGSRGSASAPNSVRRGPRSRSASMGCAIRLRVARGDGPRSWCASAAPSRPASWRTAALVLTLRLAARRPRRLPRGCSWAAPPAVGRPRARCAVQRPRCPARPVHQDLTGFTAPWARRIRISPGPLAARGASLLSIVLVSEGFAGNKMLASVLRPLALQNQRSLHAAVVSANAAVGGLSTRITTLHAVGQPLLTRGDRWWRLCHLPHSSQALQQS